MITTPTLNALANQFDQFTALGEQVETQYRRCNYNPADLPAIAAEALAQFDGEFSFDTAALADFFATTFIPQQPGLRFSDLPVTVFRQREFYIEILIWTKSTTSVHQHGFSGAFKVLQGSSIHTTFEFQPQREISPDCILGAVIPQQTRYLTKGATQQIHPGSEGLIHSLYHLDYPSLTLVVRTHGHLKHQPQYTYYRPCFAINQFQLEKDDLVVMYAKLLHVANQIDRDSVMGVWLDNIAQFDFPRLAYLFFGNLGYFQDAADQQAFLDKARLTHGDLIDSLQEAAEFKKKLGHISQSRTLLTDPDLRYFLALLMNAKDRAALLDMVAVRYLDQDPLECCARWLARLSQGKQDTAKRLAQVVQQANVGALHLGRKLGVALPADLPEGATPELFAAFMRHGANSEGLAALQQQYPDIPIADVQRCLERLATLDELFCLRQDG